MAQSTDQQQSEEMPVEVPWSEVGPFLESAKKELESALADSDATVPSLEITLYRRNIETAEPVEEFNFIMGNVGRRMLPDRLIEDVTPKGKEQIDRSGELHEQSPSDTEKIVDEKISELLSKLSEIVPEGFSIGMRTIVTTNNPGDWCRGQRCEFRFPQFQWQWRRYYLQNDTCVKEWAGGNCG